MKKNLKIIIVLAIFAAAVFAAEEMKWQWPVRNQAEVEAILAKAPKEDVKPINIVLVSCPKDHGPNEHDYPLWQARWKKLLGSIPQVNVQIAEANQWPSREQFKTASLIVMNSWGRWNDEKLKDLEEFLSNGGGFVSVHPALITNKQYSERLAKLLGLAWEHKYSWYRYGPMKLKITDPNDPICLGVPKKIDFVDEAYWPLRGDASKIKLIATTDEPNAKDPNVIGPEPMFWTYRYGKGRVFVCILGHYDRTFDDPYLRILLLRGMAWAAGTSPYRFDPLVLKGLSLE
jgi:type 1 glutamine amidotransferase